MLAPLTSDLRGKPQSLVFKVNGVHSHGKIKDVDTQKYFFFFNTCLSGWVSRNSLHFCIQADLQVEPITETFLLCFGDGLFCPFRWPLLSLLERMKLSSLL